MLRRSQVAGQWWDLIVAMDDATSEVYSGFFVAEEGTMSTFRGLGEVIAENGLFCSLYADRTSHGAVTVTGWCQLRVASSFLL